MRAYWSTSINTLTLQQASSNYYLSMSFEKIDLLMQQAVDDRIFPGGALIFSKSGMVLFHKSYGYINVFTKEPVTQYTM